MCEQTEVRYLEGDVVWVKLGSCWWPGKVKDVDTLSEDILESFRKKPIAAVQFFDEDKYEYVKNLDQICRYNCRRKNEFIKKGLDMYRAKQREGSSFMDKFPIDVSLAEQYTGGNPDIIRDITFAPEEKPNYRNIFGSEKKSSDKKSPEKKSKLSTSPAKEHSSSWQMKLPSANGRRTQPDSPLSRPITHPRIIKMLKGEADHEVRIRQQPPPPRSRKETTPAEPYKCSMCSYTTHRLNVIIIHTKKHSEEAATNGSSRKSGGTNKSATTPASSKSGRSRSRVTPSSVGDVSDRSQILPLDLPQTPKSSNPSQYSRSTKSRTPVDSEKTHEVKASKEIQRTPEKKLPKTPLFGKRKGSKGGSDKSVKKKKSSEDFKEKLLADWGDEDPEEEEKEIEILKQELSKSETFSSPSANAVAAELNDTAPATSTPNPPTVKPKEISCFDFDEKADAILDSELEERAKKFAENRKFPRFTEEKIDILKHEIELKKKEDKEKIKSEEPVELTVVDPELKEEEEEEEEPEIIEEEEACKNDKDKDFAATFNALMAETELPSLPEVPIDKPKAISDILPQDNTDSPSHTPVIECGISGETDHDYSTKHAQAPTTEIQEEKCKESSPSEELDDEEMDLDINSMPVVMDDAVITEEPTFTVENNDISCVNLFPPVVMERSNASCGSMIPATLSIPTHVPPSVTEVASTSVLTPILSEVQSKVVTEDGSVPAPEESHGQVVESIETNKIITQTSLGKNTQVKVLKSPLRTIRTHSGTSCTNSIGTKTSGTTLIAQKSSIGGKHVFIQQSGSGQKSFYAGNKPVQQCLTLKAMPQSSQQQTMGKKLVIVKSPQGQDILTTQQSTILTTSGPITGFQHIIKGSGTILKQVPLTHNQMKTLSVVSKQKLSMQSTQAKVVLPSMQSVPKGPLSPLSPVKVVAPGTSKSKGNTILIQTSQGTTVSGTLISKSANNSVTNTAVSIQPKLSISSSIVRQGVTRPKVVATPSSGSMLQRVLVSSTGNTGIQSSQAQTKAAGSRPLLQARMVAQKLAASAPGNTSNVGVLSNIQVKRVSGIFPRAQVLQKTNLSQKTPSIQKIISVVPKTKEDTNVLKSSPSSTSIQSSDSLSSQSLPIFQPVQPNVTVAPTIPQGFQSDSIIHSTAQGILPTTCPSVQTSTLTLPAATTSSSLLTPEQIAQVMATAPTDNLTEGATATYVLVTIDDTASLQSYDNSALLGYDGTSQNSGSNTRTLYIDPASLGTPGDLENIILTINNPTSGAGTLLNIGQTNTVSARAGSSVTQNPATSIFRATGNTQSSNSASGSSQDILAAALANTDVFQPEGAIQDSLTVVNSSQSASGSVMTSRLLESTPLIASSTSAPLHQSTMLLPSLVSVLPSPNIPSANTAGVLETSLTLSQPIMTPLEVPSSITHLQKKTPVIPTSLELPLTITQPALSISSPSSYAPLSLQSISHTSESSVTDSPVSSSNVLQTVKQSLHAPPISTFHPSMPLLSEEVTDSHLQNNESVVPTPISSSLEPPQNESVPKPDLVPSYEQISESTCIAEVKCITDEGNAEEESLSEQANLPSFAQVPEISSRVMDETMITNERSSHPILSDTVTPCRELPESTSEATMGEPSTDIEPCEIQSPSEQAVSTSYAQAPKSLKDSSEMIDSSLNQSAALRALETSSEAIAVSESHDSSITQSATHVPYDPVGSTSHLPENVLQNETPEVIVLQSPSNSDTEQSYSQTPESTSSALGDTNDEQQRASTILNSHSQIPESTSEHQDDKHSTLGETKSGSYSQIPESTSHTSESITASVFPMKILDSNLLTSYQQAPESSSEVSVVSICETQPSDLRQTGISSCSQLPESTSQIHDVLSLSDSSTDCSALVSKSMPLLSDETADRNTVGIKRLLESDDSNIPAKRLRQDDERLKDQASLSPSPLPSPDLHVELDDEHLPVFARPPATNKKVYEKDDIVWVRYRNIYWPAFVTRVLKKNHKAYVKAVNSPVKESACSKNFKTLLDFSNPDRNQELLEEGKKKDSQLQAAYDKVTQFFSMQTYTNYLSPSQFLALDEIETEDLEKSTEMHSSESDVITPKKAYTSSSQSKITNNTKYIPFDDNSNEVNCTSRRRVKTRKDIGHKLSVKHKRMYERFGLDPDILTVEEADGPSDKRKTEMEKESLQIYKEVQRLPCRKHLEGIFHDRISSVRHNIFMTGSHQIRHNLRFSSGTGSVSGALGYKLVSVLDTFLGEVDSNNKVEQFGSRSDYLFNVWLPEGIIFALQRIHNIGKDEAAQLFHDTSSMIL